MTPWTAAHQASLSITSSRSSLKPMSIELVMPSSHLVLCLPLLLPPSIFPSIGVFSNESVLRIRWPKHWSFSFSISPSSEYSGLISFRIDWWDLRAVQLNPASLYFGSRPTVSCKTHILNEMHFGKSCYRVFASQNELEGNHCQQNTVLLKVQMTGGFNR